ncbi:MAG: prepilin-type N-terminal cleavage/methylation domain-containing protein, partial [Actinomycetota bacterium]
MALQHATPGRPSREGSEVSRNDQPLARAGDRADRSGPDVNQKGLEDQMTNTQETTSSRTRDKGFTLVELLIV